MTICYHLNTEYDLQACQTLYDFLAFTKGLDVSASALKLYLNNGNIEQRYCTLLIHGSGRIEYYGFVNRVITRICDKVFDVSVYDFLKLFKNRRIEM